MIATNYKTIAINNEDHLRFRIAITIDEISDCSRRKVIPKILRILAEMRSPELARNKEAALSRDIFITKIASECQRQARSYFSRWRFNSFSR